MQFTVWWVIYVDVHRPSWDSVCICYPPTYKLPDYSLWSVLPFIFKTFNTWQPLLFLYRRFAFSEILCKWNYSMHPFMSYFLLIIINLSLIHGILCIRIHSFFFSLLFSLGGIEDTIILHLFIKRCLRFGIITNSCDHLWETLHMNRHFFYLRWTLKSESLNHMLDVCWFKESQVVLQVELPHWMSQQIVTHNTVSSVLIVLIGVQWYFIVHSG